MHLTTIFLMGVTVPGSSSTGTVGHEGADQPKREKGLRHSAHDLSRSSETPVRAQYDDEMCKFCHTPHYSVSSQLLWNHAASRATMVTWGEEANGQPVERTMTGTPLPSSLLPASRRCLGCHDGSTALGDVVYSGSSGGDLISVVGPGVSQGILDPDGRVGAPVTGTRGSMAGNHPVSTPYAGQAGYNGLVSRAVADGEIGNYYPVTQSGCESSSGLCTTAPSGDGRDGSAVHLVPDTHGSSSVGVECTSCHEPHNRYGLASFLRVDNKTASGLCRSCHNM